MRERAWGWAKEGEMEGEMEGERERERGGGCERGRGRHPEPEQDGAPQSVTLWPALGFLGAAFHTLGGIDP